MCSAGLSIGAPPDLFNPRGQDWGLTGFSPRALIAGGFAPFLATVRAALRNAGGVRIDHAMGLARLWLIPEGADPADGAYLAYPLGDLLRLLALESQRHGAIVVGEDLGTVPAGFREELEIAGLHGMRVLWFERNGAGIQPARCVGPLRRRDDIDARSADRGRLVAWQGHRQRAECGRLGVGVNEADVAAERAATVTRCGRRSCRLEPPVAIRRRRTTRSQWWMRHWHSSPRRRRRSACRRSRICSGSRNSRTCLERSTSIPTGGGG